MTPLQFHLLESATLAPSAHNTQPWLLRFQGDELEIWANADRQLAAADATRADLLHALGTVLENCLLTLAHHGFQGNYRCSETMRFDRPIVRLSWTRADRSAASAEKLYRAIPIRRTSRRPYEDTPVPAAILDELQRSVSPPFQLKVVSDPGQVAAIRKLAANADLELMRDAKIQAELFHWLRFTKRDRRWYQDGLNAECMNWSGLEARIASYLLRPKMAEFLQRIGLARTVFGNVEQQAPRTPAICLLSWHPSAGDSVTARIEGGRQLQRLWLTAAANALCTHPLSSAVDHTPTRTKLFANLGVDPADLHVNLFRLGYSVPTPRSQRLMADAVLVPSDRVASKGI